MTFPFSSLRKRMLFSLTSTLPRDRDGVKKPRLVTFFSTSTKLVPASAGSLGSKAGWWALVVLIWGSDGQQHCVLFLKQYLKQILVVCKWLI